MKQTIIKAGVIGCGHLGTFHSRVYSQMDGVDFLGVYDTNTAASRRVAKSCGGRAYSSLDKLLKDADAVSIATPALTHHTVAGKSLRRGCHVLVEKPITYQPGQAKELIKMAARKKLILNVGHVQRFNPAIQYVKHLNLKPKFMEIHRLAPFGNRGTDVDVILDLMIHDIDLALFLLRDMPKSVDASGVRVASRSLDIVNARLSFKKGCIVNLTASRISSKRMRKFRIFQEGSYFSLDLAEPMVESYQVKNHEKSGKNNKKPSSNELNCLYTRPQLRETNALAEEISGFLKCILGKKTEDACTGLQGLAALEIAKKIKKKCS